MASFYVLNLFQNVPRFNFRLQKIFAEDGFSQAYLQSLVLWSCVPLLICILFLLIVTLTWSSTCCVPKTAALPKRRLRMPNGILRCVFICILLCCLCVFLALFANETTSQGLTVAKTTFTIIKHRHMHSSKQIRSINNTLSLLVTDDLKQIKNGLSNLRSLQQKYLGSETWVLRINEIEHEITNATQHLENVTMVTDNFSYLFDTVGVFSNYESERRILFSSLLSIVLVVMLTAAIVTAVRSRKGLVLFGATAVFVFVLSWCIVGGALSFNIILSDVCAHGAKFLLPYITNDVSKAQFLHYSNCSMPDFDQSPLQQLISRVQLSIEQVPVIINGISCLLGQNAAEASSSIIQILSLCQRLQRNFYDVIKELGTFDDLTSCQQMDIGKAVIHENVCHLSMFSAFIMLAACTAFGLLLFFLLIMLNCVWRSANSAATPPMDNESARILQLYDQDPFLVASPDLDRSNIPAEFYGSHVSNPRTRFNPASESVSGVDVTEASGNWRNTPPPAYESVPLLRTQTATRQHNRT